MIIIDLISKSDLVANIILLVITFLSLVTWLMIGFKFISFNKEFFRLSSFNDDLDKINQFSKLHLVAKKQKKSILTRLTSKIITQQNILNSHSHLDTSVLRDFLEREIDLELYQVEKGLSLFSLVSQIAPFLGLLGTIWGIMSAFYNIGEQGSANLSVVAPGISAALITTIWGLLVAIPATAAYFFFDHKLKKIEHAIDQFSSKVIHLPKV